MQVKEICRFERVHSYTLLYGENYLYNPKEKGKKTKYMRERRDDSPGCHVFSSGGVNRSGLRGQYTNAAAYVERTFWNYEPT